MLQSIVDGYLELVLDWEDPNPKPVLETYLGVTVVRDDLLGAGSKIRFVDYLIKNSPQHVKEWVYGSSPRWGYGQVSLAYLCQKYNKKCGLFLAKSLELHPNSLKAQSYGASVFQVPMGFMKVTEARAREYVNQKSGRTLVPFGLQDDTVYGSIIKVAREIPLIPDIVVTVAGSGTLNRGLQMAWPMAECYMVSVGHILTYDETGRGKVFRHPLKFAQKCKPKDLPPFPSVGEYDAKGWKTALDLKKANPNKTVLFWNVAD